MSLKGIISIAGFPGLYKVLAQSKSGFIVESLSDKKRLPVSSTQRISMLEDISVFTLSDDLPLTQVLLKMKETEATTPPVDAKSDPAKLRDYFRSLISDFDSERVYPSDIKKIITWYHLVKDIVDIPDPEEQSEETSAEPAKEAPEVTAEPAEAPKKKRTAKTKVADDSAPAEKPAKAPRKKKEN